MPKIEAPQSGFPNPNTLTSPERQIPSLRLIINGQGDGAAMLMDRVLADGHEVVGVVATTKGIKEGSPDPLRIKAQETGIPIVNLGQVNKPEGQEQMKKWDADLAVGFYMQAMLTPETTNIPAYGTMNLHLGRPGHAGRDTMNRDIMEGKHSVAAMAYLMNEVVDGGPVVDHAFYPNPGDKSQGSLYFKYLPEYVHLMGNAVNKMAQGIKNHRKTGEPLPVTPQDPEKIKQTPRLTEEELAINFQIMPAEQVKNYMNAGGPGATAIIEGQMYKISKPDVLLGPPLQPGRVVELTPDSATVEALQGIVTIGKRSKTS